MDFLRAKTTGCIPSTVTCRDDTHTSLVLCPSSRVTSHIGGVYSDTDVDASDARQAMVLQNYSVWASSFKL